MKKIKVYWDTQDPQDIGWAWRIYRLVDDSCWINIDSGRFDTELPQDANDEDLLLLATFDCPHKFSDMSILR